MATEMEGKGVDLAETPWKWRHMRIVLETNVANFPLFYFQKNWKKKTKTTTP